VTNVVRNMVTNLAAFLAGPGKTVVESPNGEFA